VSEAALESLALAPAARDADLVARVRAGDDAAFETLFRAHHASLCSFAYRIVGAPDVAEELVQEVFLYLWEHRAEWTVSEATAKTYLFTAVRNAALRAIRHDRVVKRYEPETIELFSRPRSTADDDLRDAELTADVRRAVATLPDRCRLVFVLSREQGLTYAQIASVLQISPKTVDVQIGRALKALRKLLGPDWP
jgi:RNA polymerase sigma-70 factor, ECF subfamily